MAKWGEGDPRWIVEERADTHNVNNWHWRETDASEWSINFLKDILPKISLEDENTGKINILEVSRIEGEASCSIRKQKFIFIFDWEKLDLRWSGRAFLKQLPLMSKGPPSTDTVKSNESYKERHASRNESKEKDEATNNQSNQSQSKTQSKDKDDTDHLSAPIGPTEPTLTKDEYTGYIKISNFDHDIESADELEIEYTFCKNGHYVEQNDLKKMLKEKAPKRIWEALTLYKESCYTNYSEKMCVSRKSSNSLSLSTGSTNFPSNAVNAKLAALHLGGEDRLGPKGGSAESYHAEKARKVAFEKTRAERKTSTGIDLDKVAPLNGSTHSLSSTYHYENESKDNLQSLPLTRTVRSVGLGSLKKSMGPPRRVNKPLQKCKSTDPNLLTINNRAGSPPLSRQGVGITGPQHMGLTRTTSSNTEPRRTTSKPSSKSASTRTSTSNLTTNNGSSPSHVVKHSLTPKTSLGTRINTKKINMTDIFDSEVEKVFNAFIDVEKIKSWSQNSLRFQHLTEKNICEKGEGDESQDSKEELRRGTKFDLFSNNVSGIITSIKPTDSLEMQWRLAQWPEGHYSNVTLSFEEKDGGTRVGGL